MKKARVVASLAGAAALVVLTANPAHAYGQEFTRTCNGEQTKYLGYTTNDGDRAYTRKYDGGSCAGHAWVRIKMNGNWYAWKHDPDRAEINGSQPIQQAQHKGCADCSVITTAPL